MKKITTYFSLIIIAIGSVSAQTNYYATSKNYAVNSVIYKCVVNDLGGVRLYAATTWQAEATQTYADGSPVNILEHPKTPPVIAADGTHNKIKGIVYGILTSAEEERIKGDTIDIIPILDLQGNITGVVYLFNNFNPTKGFCTISPVQYHKIENAIKAQVKYTITTEGRNRNFNSYIWQHSPK